MEEYLKVSASMGHAISKFILEHGKQYPISPITFKGRRLKQGRCYANAARTAFNTNLKYVEGLVSCYGVPISHAWNIDADGNVIDRTLRNEDNHIEEFFGVEFSTDYLRRATLTNNIYGLLDGYYARKTIKDLLEGKANFKGE